MDELSSNHSNVNVGCCVNSNVINHNYYVSRCLVNICSRYASDHDIVYNVKTLCACW